MVAQSEGQRQAKINVSEGDKQQMINVSEGEKLKQINEAEGRAREIELIAEATARGLRKVAEAIHAEGGKEAVNLRVAEPYVAQFGNLAKENNTMIIPSNLAAISSVVATAIKTLKSLSKN